MKNNSKERQRLAREWSRMNPKDRAMSKAIHIYRRGKQAEHGDILIMVLKALSNGQAKEKR